MKLAQPVCLTPHSRSICFVPPLTGLRSASPVLPQHIIHDPNSFPAKLYSTCDMRLCLPARMGGGEKTGIDALARASVHSPPHGGVYFRFREREGKALGVPAHTKAEAISRPSPQRGQQRHPRNSVTQTGGVAASEVGARQLSPKGQRRQSLAKARPSPDRQGKRRACHAGQPKNTAPSGAQRAEKSATSTPPAHHPTLLIVTRMGRDYRPGARKQIEQVARQGSPSCYIRQIGRTISGIRGAVLPEFCLKTSRKGRNSCIVGER